MLLNKNETETLVNSLALSIIGFWATGQSSDNFRTKYLCVKFYFSFFRRQIADPPVIFQVTRDTFHRLLGAFL